METRRVREPMAKAKKKAKFKAMYIPVFYIPNHSDSYSRMNEQLGYKSI